MVCVQAGSRIIFNQLPTWVATFATLDPFVYANQKLLPMAHISVESFSYLGIPPSPSMPQFSFAFIVSFALARFRLRKLFASGWGILFSFGCSSSAIWARKRCILQGKGPICCRHCGSLPDAAARLVMATNLSHTVCAWVGWQWGKQLSLCLRELSGTSLCRPKAFNVLRELDQARTQLASCRTWHARTMHQSSCF